VRTLGIAVLAVLLVRCGNGRVDKERLRQEASPALVQVCTSDGSRNAKQNCGDGFAISASGLVVTSYLSIRQAVKGEVITGRGTRFPIARVISYDSAKGFAVVQAAAKGWTPLKASAVLAIADGSPVVACGFGPKGAMETKIQGKETAGTYTILHLSESFSEGGGDPVLNSNGLVIGMTLPRTPSEGTRILPVHYILGSIRKDEKGFGLWEVAQIQGSADKKESELRVMSQFGRYGDRFGAFRSLAPRNWRTIESERQLGDEAAGVPPSHEVHVLFVPPDVTVTDPYADPPAGIRARVSLADRNRTWVHKTEQELLPAIAYQMSTERPGFVRSAQRFTRLGSLDAGYLDIAGVNLRIRTYLVAGAKCRVLVEMFSPPNSAAYDEIFERFRAGFEFDGCPEYED
jgi:hypothetical protein